MRHARRRSRAKKTARTAAKQPLVEPLAKKKRDSNRYTKAEIKKTVKRRNKLISEGLTDAEIGRQIGRETGRSWRSLIRKIQRMVDDGIIKKNPNKRAQKMYSEKETESVVKRTNELVAKGLADIEIARKIAKEKKRGRVSVLRKIQLLRANGVLGKNPNKPVRTAPKKPDPMIKNRNKLVSQGLADCEIAWELAEKTQKTRKTVLRKIRKLVGEEKMAKNPNRHLRLTPKDINEIIRRREELKAIGLSDAAIAKLLANESGKWDARKLENVLCQLRVEGMLEKNENSNTEAERIVLLREELMSEGKSDNEVAVRIAKKMKRRPETIRILMLRIIKRGKCRENPNDGKGDRP